MVKYEDFKKATNETSFVIDRAYEMNVVSEEYQRAWDRAMNEAREIFLRLDDETER